MSKKGLTLGLASFSLVCYFAIILYVLFAIMQINTLDNFVIGIVFEIIGFFLLTYFVLSNIIGKQLKTGYFVPLIIVTIIYTVILDVINIAFVAFMPPVFFALIHFILLFVYGIVSIPMYVMGKK